MYFLVAGQFQDPNTGFVYVMTTEHQQNGMWRSAQGQYAQPGVVMQPLVSQPNGEVLHEQKWGQLYAHQDEHLPHVDHQVQPVVSEHHTGMPTITYQDAPAIQMQEDTPSPEAAAEPSQEEQPANIKSEEEQTSLTTVSKTEISQES